MKKFGTVIFTISVMFFLSDCGKKLPEIPGAVVTNVKGDVQKISGGKTEQVKLNSIFKPLDSIKTGKGSFADLQLVDGVLIRIKENSDVTLAKLAIDRSNMDMDASLKLTAGSMFSKLTSKLMKGSKFNVVTPTSVAGVRGTEFLVKENGDQSETLVNDGSVNVNSADENGNPTGNDVPVDAGKKAVAEKNKKVTTKELTDEEKAMLSEDSKSIQQLSAEMKEQLQKMLADQKAADKAELEGQKDRDKGLLDSQKQGDQQLLDEQKAKDKAMMGEIKDQAKSEKEGLKNQGKSEMKDIKGKKSPKDQLAPNN